MQYFERDSTVPPPAFLNGSEVRQARRRLLEYFGFDPERRAQTRVPQLEKPLDHPSVREALAKLFHDKCAFCEANVPTRPHRFRPPFEALPLISSSGLIYYAWLAEAWENIYPICSTCKPFKPHEFPTDGPRAPVPGEAEIESYVTNGKGRWKNYPIPEKPLLLDPCWDRDLHDHLLVSKSGKLTALTPRGVETIAHFNLERPERAASRRERLEEYAAVCMDLAEPGGSSRMTPAGIDVFDFERLEHGGAWYLLLRSLVATAASTIGVRSDSSPAGVQSYEADLSKKGVAELVGGPFLQLIAPLLSGPEGFASSKLDPGISRAGRHLATPVSPFTGVEIENFKSLERIELKLAKVERDASNLVREGGPEPALIILGENAAGKSSILEAIALALCTPQARDALGLDLSKFLLDPSFLSDSSAPKRRLAKVVASLEPRRALGQADPPQREIRIGARGSVRDSARGTFHTVPVFAYGAFRQYLKGQSPSGPDRYVRSLFHSDYILPNPTEWLLGLPKPRFDEVVQTIRSILSIEEEFEVIERRRNRCFVAQQVTAADGSVRRSLTPLDSVSSGFRAILAMVCDILEGLMDPAVTREFETFKQARAIVLIDEVEAHLHPRWKMQIMHGLRQALPQVQFIVTTHDPLCLRGMKSNEVKVLHRVPGEEIPETDLPSFVETLTDLPNVAELTVEQLLTSDFFQLNSTADPETERRFALVADLIQKERSGKTLDQDDRAALNEFRDHLASTLPIGSSEAQQLVQEAVAEYLRDRRTRTRERLKLLRDETKARIRRALEEI